MSHTPSYSWGNQRGSTYLILMFVVVIMTIGGTVAAKQWKTVMQREKEADLLARGMEIQTAIGAYLTTIQRARVVPGLPYPLTMEELTKGPKPYLRKLYKDPITGGDWEYVRDPATGGIKGVRSRSTAAPIKQHQFPPAVAHFEGLAKYNEWLFQYPSASTIQAPQGGPGQPVPGGQPLLPGQVPPGFPPPPGFPSSQPPGGPGH